MSLSRRISIDRETAIAIALLWAIVLTGALLFGQDLVPALATSFLVTFILSLAYLIGDQDGRQLVGNPIGALAFLAIGLVIVLFFFAGDCLFGSLHAPNAPLLEACVHNSGIGFVFTLFALAVAIGVPLVGLLRMLVIKVGKHRG